MKDQYTGKMTTMENTVKGPTSVFKTTTNPETDPETRSRFIILSVDESKAQTRRILKHQRYQQTLEGYLNKGSQGDIICKHHNFQRILENLVVVNPYAETLQYMEERIQVRRDHPKYLALINTVAFLRQHQKEVKHYKQGSKDLRYIEVDLEDIALAQDIARGVLGPSLDELSAPSRELLKTISQHVKQEMFKQEKSQDEIIIDRREIREFSGWSHYQVKTHLKQLIELGYLIPVRGEKVRPTAII